MQKKNIPVIQFIDIFIVCLPRHIREDNQFYSWFCKHHHHYFFDSINDLMDSGLGTAFFFFCGILLLTLFFDTRWFTEVMMILIVLWNTKKSCHFWNLLLAPYSFKLGRFVNIAYDLVWSIQINRVVVEMHSIFWAISCSIAITLIAYVVKGSKKTCWLLFITWFTSLHSRS